MHMASVRLIIISDDEVIVAASERSAIRTVFNVGENEVLELMPGKGTDCKIRWHVFSRTNYYPPKNEGPAVLNVFIFPEAAMKRFTANELHSVIT